MTDAGNKANRLLQIEAILLARPEGVSPAELARRLGVHRSTVGRYLPDLPGAVYLDDLDGGRWKLDREKYQFNVRFNLHEALALHLASRLLESGLERQNRNAAAALRKLGAALQVFAPQISQHICNSADLMDGEQRRCDPIYLEVLEKLTSAWGQGRKVRLWHHKDRREPANEYVFAPYFIEPNAAGQSTYAIGWREPPGALRTFKIERIERVELLEEHYAIPEDFDALQLLGDAWGIWYSESEPREVRLRFSPRVAQRLGETRWHRSEQVTGLEDGSLLWRAWIAAPQEMLPWIRGWGADVEVLAPEELRQKIATEARQTAQNYGWVVQDEPE